jgi:hypothetical protein
MSVALTDTAHVVAQILSRRNTPREEVTELMRSVHGALTRLAGPGSAEAGETADKSDRATPQKRRQQPRQRSERPLAASVEAEPDAAPPPPPKLVRRAEMVAAAPAAAPHPLFDMPNSALRGVVKWFDTHTRRGALRLPGHGGDVPVEPGLLVEMGVSRLYKGQEIEATLSEDPEPRVVRLALPGGTAPALPCGGIVRGRHAKPVVVEMKREALRRVAARAEAEQLLRPGRSR